METAQWNSRLDHRSRWSGTGHIAQIKRCALELSGPANPHADLPLTDWADLAVGPAGASELTDEAVFDLVELAPESAADDVLELGTADEFAALAETPGGDSMGLADYLASARELAELARGSEEIGRAHV